METTKTISGEQNKKIYILHVIDVIVNDKFILSLTKPVDMNINIQIKLMYPIYPTQIYSIHLFDSTKLYRYKIIIN